MSVFEGTLQASVRLPQSLMGLFPHLPLVLTYIATPSTQPQLRAASLVAGFLARTVMCCFPYHLSTTLIVTIPLICTPTPTCLAMPLRTTTR